ncbi:hypothetical protein GC194_08435 [bacterium]|nr:hypothetical protein [bacterium]
MRNVLIAILAIGLLACSANKKETENTAATCAVDSTAKEADVNKKSELAVLMRKMDADLREWKMEAKAGKRPDISLIYEAILTATPTKANLRDDEDFAAYANSYLMGIDRLKNSSNDSLAVCYNALVAKCIDCHNSFCTGPVSRIKKLAINPQKVAVGN